MTKTELSTDINRMEEASIKFPKLEKTLSTAISKARERLQLLNNVESYKEAIKDSKRKNSIERKDTFTDNQKSSISYLIVSFSKENNYNPDNLLIFKNHLFTEPIFVYYSLSSTRNLNVSDEQLNYLRNLISISKKRQNIYIDDIKCFYNLKFGNSLFISYKNSSITTDGGIDVEDKLIEIELNGNVIVHTQSFFWKNWFFRECKEVDFMVLEQKKFLIEYDEYFLIEVSIYGDTNLIDSFLSLEERYNFLPLISKEYETKEFL